VLNISNVPKLRRAAGNTKQRVNRVSSEVVNRGGREEKREEWRGERGERMKRAK